MAADRAILIVADDYGIGPETSRGILELAETGRLSATVLLVNTPFSEAAVVAWQRAGRPLELGWHPNLTLDRPILDPAQVPSLVDGDGQFWKLNRFLMRASLGRIQADDATAELAAQYDRFCQLVGHVPRLVNSHQHVAAFGPVGTVLMSTLERQIPRPFLRRLGEPLRTLWRISGARFKRLILTQCGRSMARESRRRGFPGCDMLAGITDPPCVFDDLFYTRWLNTSFGNSVELMVHPGHDDATLIGRDCSVGMGAQRRPRELDLMNRPEFLTAIQSAGFRIASVNDFMPSAFARAA
jgi:predicted glycoside hydrolase/deacetylase ChbG (UPF0249 family)